jgi:NitT/TauT family transport system permease protein
MKLPGPKSAVWPYLASIAALLVAWQGAASLVQDRVLPTPAAVWIVLERDVENGTLLHHLAITLARVAVSFFLALLIGSAIGIVMGRSILLDRLGDAWLIVFLNLPALVTIVLCYVWFGLTEVAAILAVTINKVPNVVVTMREGTRALSRDLLEMAQVFRFGRYKTLRHVILPALGPFIIAAARSGLAIVWKIVLVVELLGRSSGVGFQINLFFQLFDVAGILAYTIAFVAVIQLLELGVMQPLERRANKWRR